MPAEPQLYELLDLFAARAVAELRRLRAEAATREREAQLSLLLDTAMDAILVLDRDFKITRLNPRATELFACTEEDLAGESFLDFLSPNAAAKFSKLTQELQARPRERPLWLPEGLETRRSDRKPVPAEAAISRYLYHGAPYYTVFLAQYERAIGSGAAYPRPGRGDGILACCCRGGAGRVGDHRPQCRNPSRLRCHPPGCSDERDGSHPRGNRHRKGTRRPSYP